MTPLTEYPEWKYLQTLAAQDFSIADALENEAGRMDALWLETPFMVADLSKQAMPLPAWQGLLDLARARDVEAWRDRMLAGDSINTTEARAVWHTALRGPLDANDSTQADIAQVRDQIKALSDAIRADTSVTDIIHIGIGGSDLGPRLVCKALAAYHTGPRVHFVSNVDPDDLDPLLATLNPAGVRIIVVSKTFTTQETLLNAKAAKMWLTTQLGEDAAHARLMGVTTNTEEAQKFGVPANAILPFWDWVGGRFSLWSAVGLSIAIACGFDHFMALLAGAHAVDQHIVEAPMAQNIPLALALVGIWNINFKNYPALAVLPYAQSLDLLCDYLQQLDMESNGKRVDRDGVPVSYATAPIVFGQPGTNGQHAFHQLLHQGPAPIPCDFIGMQMGAGCPGRHRVLMAHMRAQARALMVGRVGDTPHKTCPGNRPSTTLLLPALTPTALGALLAVYEHKIAYQGWIWGINSFDQYGVELGKALANDLLAGHGELDQNNSLDKSTRKQIFHTFASN